MGHSTQRAERVHLNCVLAHAVWQGTITQVSQSTQLGYSARSYPGALQLRSHKFATTPEFYNCGQFAALVNE